MRNRKDELEQATSVLDFLYEHDRDAQANGRVGAHLYQPPKKPRPINPQPVVVKDLDGNIKEIRAMTDKEYAFLLEVEGNE